MIHIIGDFYIRGGARDFTLCRKTRNINKKTNKPIYSVEGYYSNVSTAIQAVQKTMQRELTAEQDMELNEAVRAFKEIGERLEKATEGLR